MDTRARQDALVGYLRARASATAVGAAVHFGVSVRTLHRDLAELRERGVPIESEPGRGGGIRLDPARSLVPIRLSLDEVVGLLVAVTLSRRAANIPFGRAAQHAMDKVLASLPEGRARSLKRTLQRVVVGAPASPQVVASLVDVQPAVLDAFERGFSEQRALSFAYVDRTGVSSRRHVEPHGLLLQTPAWYLLALDIERAAPRMFRLDRISRPSLLTQAFEPLPLSVFEVLLRDVPSRAGLSDSGG